MPRKKTDSEQVSVKLERDILKKLDQKVQKGKRSEFINRVLRQVLDVDPTTLEYFEIKQEAIDTLNKLANKRARIDMEESVAKHQKKLAEEKLEKMK